MASGFDNREIFQNKKNFIGAVGKRQIESSLKTEWYVGNWN